jgi:hypothetical protein
MSIEDAPKALQSDVHSAAIQLLNGLQTGDVLLQGAQVNADGQYTIPLSMPRQWNLNGVRDFFSERTTTRVTIGQESNGNIAVGALAPDPNYSRLDDIGSHHLRKRVVSLGYLGLGTNRENTVRSGMVHIERGRLLDDTPTGTPYESQVAHSISPEAAPLSTTEATTLLTVLTMLDARGRAADRASRRSSTRMLGSLTAQLALA